MTEIEVFFGGGEGSEKEYRSGLRSMTFSFQEIIVLNY